ncbi:response regulator transcription factor [Inquilinus sp.]|jgi:DNA-binding CsgD family transcriptional regulator|uniref:response regulator transcription factor n=1 Tax=Inquilinus sp. TaxID=1932117 RepID=UPI003783BB4E
MFDRSDPSSGTTPTLPSGRRRLRADPRIPSTSPPGEDDVSRLVGQVYDAAIGGEAWGTVVTGLRGLLGAESGALFPAGYGVPSDTAIHVGCDPAYIPPYNDYYVRKSPLVPLVPRLPAGSVFTNHMVVPERTYARSEYYNDHIRPQGKFSNISWLDAAIGGRRSYLCLWRQRWQPAWEPAALRVLAAVGPHLGRALEIQRRLAAAAPRAAAAAPPGLLAPRERDCLAGVAGGASSKQIARALGLSMNTVNAYLASAKRKLKAASRSEAVAMALSAGMIDV